jgi:signal transduction histidine kinase
MDKEKLKRNIFQVSSVLIVGVALVTISIIQYKWLITSTEKDLTELYKNINFQIERNIAIELEEEFYKFRDLYDSEFKDIQDIKNYMEESYGTYTKTLSILADKKKYTYNGISWEIIESNFLPDKKMGFLVPDDKNLVQFAFPIKNKREILGIIQFDIESFYRDKIANNSNLLSSEYELQWYFKQPKNSIIINEWDYKYSPVQNIGELFTNKKTNWLFAISFFVDVFKPREFARANIAIRAREYNPMEDSHIFVNIMSGGKSIISIKEDQITLQWLLSLLLLSGIGIAYIYILSQINKINKLRSREKIFVATITHELRTPLTVINSAADNIASGIIKPDKLKNYGDLIKAQSNRLSGMIEGILLFSRLEGKVEKTPILAPLNLDDILLELGSTYPQLRITNTVNTVFLSHRESILQILHNLVKNAIVHGYHGDVSKEVRLKTHIKMPNKVVFQIEDDGSGIDKRDIKHIFKAFYRAEKSYVNQAKGSGLGLFIAYSKAKLIQGELEIESPYQRINGQEFSGSRFTLSIPYLKPEDNK